jgi:hypothetical protein
MAYFVKRMASGALVLAAAAYAWALVFLAAPEISSTALAELPLLLVILPAYALLITSWFALPLGAVLGVLLPWTTRDSDRIRRAIIGAAVGAVVGTLVAVLTVLLEGPNLFSGDVQINWDVWLPHAGRRFLRFAATMVPFCAIWIGVWAYRVKESNPRRA